jgi:hypothetical protein
MLLSSGLLFYLVVIKGSHNQPLFGPTYPELFVYQESITAIPQFYPNLILLWHLAVIYLFYLPYYL